MVVATRKSPEGDRDRDGELAMAAVEGSSNLSCE